MIPGSLWISGCTLHYIDQNSNHQSIEGQLDQQIQSQVPGSIWAEQDGVDWYLCYICEEKHKHKLLLSQSEDGINQNQVPGSIWIDGGYIKLILQNDNIKYQYVADFNNTGSGQVIELTFIDHDDNAVITKYVSDCNLVFERESDGVIDKYYVSGPVIGTSSLYSPGTVLAKTVNDDPYDPNFGLYYICDDNHVHKVMLSDNAIDIIGGDNYLIFHNGHPTVKVGNTVKSTIQMPLTVNGQDQILGFTERLNSGQLKMCYSPGSNVGSQYLVNIADPNYIPTYATLNDPEYGSIAIVPDYPMFGRYQLEFNNENQTIRYENQEKLAEIYSSDNITISFTLTSYIQENPEPIPEDDIPLQLLLGEWRNMQYNVYSFGNQPMNYDDYPNSYYNYGGHRVFILNAYGRTYLVLKLRIIDEVGLTEPFLSSFNGSYVSEYGVFQQLTLSWDEEDVDFYIGFRLHPNKGHNVIVRQYRTVDPLVNDSLLKIKGLDCQPSNYAVEFGLDGNFIRLIWPQNLMFFNSNPQRYYNNTLPPIVLGSETHLFGDTDNMTQFTLRSFLGKIGRFSVQTSSYDCALEQPYGSPYNHGTQLIVSEDFESQSIS